MEASDSPNGIDEGEREFYVMLAPRSDGFVWLERYMGEKHAIMEDFGVDSIDYRTMLRLTDKWWNLNENKYGSVQWSPDHIYITSNIHPKMWYPKKEPEDTWGTGPLARRLKGSIKHMIRVHVSEGEQSDEED